MTNRLSFSLSIAVLLAVGTCFRPCSQSWAQDSPPESTLNKSLVQELDQLRAKVLQLEQVIGNNDQSAKRSMGMGMSMGKKMSGRGENQGNAMGGQKMAGQKMAEKGMALGKKMAGRGMMGRGPKMRGKPMESAYPGFPGASHLYHIGETGFFLDHPEHISLSADQQKKLNDVKTKTLLADATFERQIDEAEQQMWVLTAAAKPEIAKIEAKVREIGKLEGDRRLAYIRSVGNAASVLTDAQRQTLAGEYLPEEEPTSSSE